MGLTDAELRSTVGLVLRFDSPVLLTGGRHYCLGAALARMEGEVGLRTLFERYPELRVEQGAVRRRTRILRGYEHLPVTLPP